MEWNEDEEAEAVVPLLRRAGAKGWEIIKEGFFANHTFAARKLTCPSCGHHGFCVEVAAESEVQNHG